MTTPQNLPSPQAPPARYEVRVLGITWERVHLTIQVQATAQPHADLGSTPSLAFEIVDAGRVFPVISAALGDGLFDLHINVTTFADRREVPNGTWRIRLAVNGEPDAVATLDVSRLDLLETAERVFLYNSNRNAYTVTYAIAENEIALEFLMRVFEFTRVPAADARKSLLRRARASVASGAAKQRYARWVYAFFSRWIGPKRGRLLFASDQRSAMEGNLLRVHERLVERGLANQFDMKYSFRLPASTNWTATIRILYLLATSEIVLLDDYFAMLKSIDVDSRTKIIQLWHAGSGFKAVGFSRFGQAGSPMLENSHRDYTYAITGSEHLIPVYAEAFGIEPESVIATGLPRVDWFLDEARRQEFRDEFFGEYPAFLGKRIILFAPTFRGRSIKSAFYDYDLIDFDGLAKAVGPNTVVLFRMHHFVREPITIPPEYADIFFDFTRYPKGLELLQVTDLLITDYSSIIYEYSLLDRPMLFFAPDKLNYAATRGFHREFDDTAPGRVCTTFDEVLKAITRDDFQREKVAKFRSENFDRVDTGSADRVIDWLILADPNPGARHASHRSQPAKQWVEEPEQEQEEDNA